MQPRKDCKDNIMLISWLRAQILIRICNIIKIITKPNFITKQRAECPLTILCAFTCLYQALFIVLVEG